MFVHIAFQFQVHFAAPAAILNRYKVRDVRGIDGYLCNAHATLIVSSSVFGIRAEKIL